MTSPTKPITVRFAHVYRNSKNKPLAIIPESYEHTYKSLEALNDHQVAQYKKSNRKYHKLIAKLTYFDPSEHDVYYCKKHNYFALIKR